MKKLKLRARWWWVAGAILMAVAAFATAVFPESEFAEVFFVFALLWGLASLVLVTWWVWRWMTYRVGVRLFFTFLLVGVLPLLFAAAFAGLGLYILMGQYTSVRIGSEFERFNWALAEDCEEVLEIAYETGSDAALSFLDELALDPPEPIKRVLWWATIGGKSATVGGEVGDIDFGWLPEGPSSIMAMHDGKAYSITARRAPSGDRVVALLPFDAGTGADLSSQWWFDVAFYDLDESSEDDAGGEDEGGDEVLASASSEGSVNFSIGGEQLESDDIWPRWQGGDDGLMSRPLVVWFRVVPEVFDLETGAEVDKRYAVALLRTSPRNVWNDFTLSRYELGRELWGVLAGLGLFFLVGWGLALTGAGTVVYSIVRSTSRLSHGAKQVEMGNLDHRVPVKRRDQLGDLAVSFNHMTDSVQSMIADVAEKERLAQELELAREIQESLLPARHLEVGPVTVWATFTPATEVGGDYFDVFPLSENRLVVAIGDVAGHGLSTGLLMASLKSSVAALVHEGYGGSDLIDRVNHLLMDHGQGRTLVTLTVVEIDLDRNRLVLTNAGHCPALLIRPGEELEELMAGSLPMGSRLCRPAAIERRFPAETRLVLYSDGLVEAISPDGEPFGYEHLAEVLGSAVERSEPDLTSEILDALARHADGVPASDDLTILVIERC